MSDITSAEQWPTSLSREKALAWNPGFGNERGEHGLDGTSQFRNFNGLGTWRCSLLGEQLRNPDQIRDWMAMQVLLLGGRTPVDIPLMLCALQPQAVFGVAPHIMAVNAGWNAGEMSGRIELVDSYPLLAGMHFSDYDPTTYGWRLHRVSRATEVSTYVYDIEFWPPARFDVANNHDLEIGNPRCCMRLVEADSMELRLELRRRDDPNADFEEAYP